MKKQVYTLLTLAAILLGVTASTASAGGVSSAAVLYLRVAAGARAGGMGEGFVAIADDATATYWNPAGLGNAPIAGHMVTENIPEKYGDIKEIITLRGYNGDSETWAIADDELLMYDGKSWQGTFQYTTSSDQTLLDFLRTIITVEDDEELSRTAEKVVTANCDVTRGEVDAFIESVIENVPRDYKEWSDLQLGLDSLVAGYTGCLLSTELFHELQKKLAEGMADSTLSTDEIDRITYSLAPAIMRFLPSRLEVPFAAVITGHMTSLAATGSYLWVGSENGLYRRSGINWAKYTVAGQLPSDTILSMASVGENLLIGTSLGLAKYFQGTFSVFPDLPQAPVAAIAFGGPDLAYAVIGNVLYKYDGKRWFEAHSYTVRFDDTIENLVERFGIYNTSGEHDYLIKRLNILNERSLPAGMPDLSRGAATNAAEAEGADAEANADTTGNAEAAPDEEMMEEGETAAEPDAMEDVEELEESPETPWLVEGNVIQAPYSPKFRFDVTMMYVDIHKTLWVGTTSGLLSFDGDRWTRYGYKAVTIPGPDSNGTVITMTASEIARDYLPMGDSGEIAALATNIDLYNEMNNQPVTSGDVIYVYNHNIGSEIHSIGSVFGDVYVGTAYSLEKRLPTGWESVHVKGISRDRMFGAYDYNGEIYYAGTSSIGVETKGQREFVAMFVKWLPNLNLDMYYAFMSYVHHARGLGTFGISAIYLTYGSIPLTDEYGTQYGEGNPYELTVAASYGTSLSNSLKIGGSIKFIHSHLSEQGAGAEEGSGIASAFAVDAGVLYRITKRMQFGAAVSNLGPDIAYIDVAQADPLPRNMAVGFSYKLWDTPYNRLIVQAELDKMIVDVNRTFSEELEYAIRHFGGEYVYANFLALRAGYKYDKEGQVKHLTFGAGLQYEGLHLDMAYIPSSTDSPLANTLRISFSVLF